MLSVIIPVYNERHTIMEILRRVCSVAIRKQIIVVDDFSTDGTRDILKELQKNIPPDLARDGENRFHFEFVVKNGGKGAAIREGVKYIEETFAIVQDADLEYDPNDYPVVLAPLLAGDADVVYGSRFAGSTRRVLFFWHSMGNKMLTLFSNMMTNLNLTDMETGYKAFRSDILKGIPLRSNRFGIEPELTAKVAKLGCRIFEVPISYHGRTYAEGKKIGLKDAFQALWVIFKYWLIDDLNVEGAAGVRTLRIMEGATRYNEWLFETCQSYLGQNVLEMGSGLGNITKFLKDRKRVLATDISDVHLRTLAREFSHFKHIKVSHLDLMDEDAAKKIASEEQIDSILSMNVLEHIKDDKRALSNCFTMLQPGGRIVVLVPAHQMLYSPMDKNLEHHRRYDLADLKTLLIAAGFQIVTSRYLNMLGALGWFVNGRIFRRELVPSRQLRIFDAILSVLKFEKYVAIPFGLSCLVIASKPLGTTARRAESTHPQHA